MLLSGLWLLLGFGAFMALIWSVYAVNRAAAIRFGYEPFSLPNAALMLVANLLLLSALAPADAPPTADAGLRNAVMLGAAAALALGLLGVIARRSSLWYALYAVALLSVGAIAVFPSLVFMRLAAASRMDDAGAGGSHRAAAVAPGQADQGRRAAEDRSPR